VGSSQERGSSENPNPTESSNKYKSEAKLGRLEIGFKLEGNGLAQLFLAAFLG
jgi:hypothetical protein